MPKRSTASRFPGLRTLITSIQKNCLDGRLAPAYKTQHKYRRKHTLPSPELDSKPQSQCSTFQNLWRRQYLTCPLRLKNDRTALTRRTENNQNRWFLMHPPYLRNMGRNVQCSKRYSQTMLASTSVTKQLLYSYSETEMHDNRVNKMT
jgi:hypothetical protein